MRKVILPLSLLLLAALIFLPASISGAKTGTKKQAKEVAVHFACSGSRDDVSVVTVHGRKKVGSKKVRAYKLDYYITVKGNSHTDENNVIIRHGNKRLWASGSLKSGDPRTKAVKFFFKQGSTLTAKTIFDRSLVLDPSCVDQSSN